MVPGVKVATKVVIVKTGSGVIMYMGNVNVALVLSEKNVTGSVLSEGKVQTFIKRSARNLGYTLRKHAYGI